MYSVLEGIIEHEHVILITNLPHLSKVTFLKQPCHDFTEWHYFRDPFSMLIFRFQVTYNKSQLFRWSDFLQKVTIYFITFFIKVHNGVQWSVSTIWMEGYGQTANSNNNTLLFYCLITLQQWKLETNKSTSKFNFLSNIYY